MLGKAVQAYWIIISFFLTVSWSFQTSCLVNQIVTDGKCFSCNLILNIASTPMLADHRLNVCICKVGYQWSSIDLKCLAVDKNMFQRQMLPFQEQSKRLLTTSCNISKGFININGICFNCRNISKSTGFASDSDSCFCYPLYTWINISKVCACIGNIKYNPLYKNGDICSACNQISDKATSSQCGKCYGSIFAQSQFGCINCTAIPHGQSTQVNQLNGNCACDIGYTYSSLLGECICNDYHFSTGSDCQSCSSLNDQKLVKDCNECENSFFYNGNYCQPSSNIKNINSSIGVCQKGYALKTNPIRNQIIGCACSAVAGYYINKSSCQPCSFLTNISKPSYQSCMSCSQTDGYFRGTVECIYCVTVPSSTGVATVDGCECRSTYSWNTLENLCQCDWAQGYFTKGDTCLNCLNIANTITSTNNIGCNCKIGFSWNATNSACECNQDIGNIYLLDVEGCVNCNGILGSTGRAINGKSCQCITGFIWSSSQVTCNCDASQNFIVINSHCLDCVSKLFTNGFATSFVCGCEPGYIWIKSEGTCGCPQGYVNMGNQCISCLIAISNLTGATLEGCNNCSINQGFAFSSDICYACSKQTATVGTASDLNGCDCTNTEQTWQPDLGGCVCMNFFGNDSLGCLQCTDNCSCMVDQDNNGNLYNICVTCQAVDNSPGTLKDGSCICYPGYSWSIDLQLYVYPFQCVCNIEAGGYFNASTCYNCSQITANENITVTGCKKCDPSQGFLKLRKNNSCILCSTQPGSNGKATASGCGCLLGVWNINTLVCDFFNCNITNCHTCSSNESCFSCADGYMLTFNQSNCSQNCFISYCDYCSSSNTCQSCIRGYRVNSDSSRCLEIHCFATCIVCLADNLCLSCQNGYMLSNDSSQCLIDCGISNCKTCASFVTCSECSEGFHMTDEDITTCLLTCKDLNCLLCQTNSNSCIECKLGFNLFNQQCYYNCIINCQLCLSNTTCLTCFNGYSPSYDRKECLLTCNNSNCQICSNLDANCTQCAYGYTLSTGQCYLNFCDVPKCQLCRSPSSCEQCEANFAYIFASNNCVPVCVPVIPNCVQCLSLSQCSACQAGYSLGLSSANVSECSPLCSISNCWICLSSKECASCKGNYRLSLDKMQCQLACSVMNCDICQNLITCSQCQSGYTLNNNLCILQCQNGYYNSGTSQKSICNLCSNIYTSCSSCDYVNNSLVCLSCPSNLYLNFSNNQCVKCKDQYINCYTCSNEHGCTSCFAPFNLASNGTCQILVCTVPNCLYCSTISNLTCLTCSNGFIYNSQTGICEFLVCPPQFIFQGENCACPEAYMLVNSECLPCFDSHCLSCNSFGCLACITGYYSNFNLVCLSCPFNCDVCTSQYCSQCSIGFSYSSNGICISIGSGVSSLKIEDSFVSCGPGCSACVLTSNKQISCTKSQDGFVIFNGIAMECVGSVCRTCTIDNNLCTSCFHGYSLQNGNCLACIDLNALTCLATNLNYSLSCYPRYTAAGGNVSAGGYCQLCADNCLKCDFNGPNKCDAFQCTLGFVQLLGTFNCTACLNSCSVCDNNDLNLCFDCGPRRFKNDSGKCYACPQTCKACTLATFCTACLSGYSLINGFCMPNLDFPCAVTGANFECTQCFEGYILNGTFCVKDLNCNKNSNCIACPYGYSLFNSTCVICPHLPQNCQTCDSVVGLCILCKKGFYFSGYNCQPCEIHCKSCSSSFCKQAVSGFYLEVLLNGSNSGRIKACTSPCLTCAYSSNYCITCMAGYNISGSTCFSTSIINIELVLGPSTSVSSIFSANDTDQIQLVKILNNINWLTASFCSILIDSLKISGSCDTIFRFTSLSVGSIIVDAQINTNGIQDIEQAQNSITQNLNTKGIPGVSIVTISMTSPASQDSPPQQSISSTSSMLPIIIGVCFGGLANVIVIVILIKVLKRRRIQIQSQQLPLQSDPALSGTSFKQQTFQPKQMSQKSQIIGYNAASSQSINRDQLFEQKSIKLEQDKN